jgi:hypothetical protein
MAEAHAMAAGIECAGLEQRILHTRGLLLHRYQRLSNLHWAHMPSAQVADLLYLEEIEKGVALSGGQQPSPLPGCQLPGANPQNSNEVFSTISIHVCNGATRIIGSQLRLCNWKIMPPGTFSSNIATRTVQDLWAAVEDVPGHRTAPPIRTRLFIATKTTALGLRNGLPVRTGIWQSQRSSKPSTYLEAYVLIGR